MESNIRALVARVWKDADLQLAPGRHHFDEVVTIRVTGSVEKQGDQLVAPTVSVPLLLTLAVFVEKSGITREHALRLLREALVDALTNGTPKDEEIQSRMKDCEKAVEQVKRELISRLPKAKRSGRVITKDLEVEVLPVSEEELSTAAA